MKFSAVIFDMDGLMLDTERTYRDVFNRAAADCDFVFSQDLHDRLLGRTSTDTRIIMAEALADDAKLQQFLDRMANYHHECFAATPPAIKRGLHELLDFIESKNVPKVVATSTRRTYAIPRLEQSGLLHRFASVTAGDQVKHGKPAPDLFLAAAATIDVPPNRCVVLEDSEAGVTGAHAAGMAALMVPDMKQPCEAVRCLASGVYESLVEVR